MTVATMALAIMCINIPLGHTQAGPVPAIEECAPDSTNRICSDISGNGIGKEPLK